VLLDGLGRIMAGCATMLHPGGTLVITSRPVRRRHGDLIDLPGQFIDTATAAGQRLHSARWPGARPDAGAGTSLVGAIRAGRHAIGVDVEPWLAALAQANLDLAKRDHAPGEGFLRDERQPAGRHPDRNDALVDWLPLCLDAI
jgi:hypothetical protein